MNTTNWYYELLLVQFNKLFPNFANLATNIHERVLYFIILASIMSDAVKVNPLTCPAQVAWCRVKLGSLVFSKGPFIIYRDHRPGRETYDRVLNFFHLSLTCFEFFLPRNDGCWIFLNSASQIFRTILYLKKNWVRKEAEYNRNTILIYNGKMGRLFYIATELFLFPIWLSQTPSNFSQWQSNCITSVKYIYICYFYSMYIFEQYGTIYKTHIRHKTT